MVPILEDVTDGPHLQVVVETDQYLSKAEKLLSESEREEVVLLVADIPDCGEVMVGTGGVRKVRFARQSQGKRGGYRVIYFFHDADMPIYLLTVFAKNQKANLSKAERNQLRKLTALLVEAQESRRSR